jgi:3-methyladenine DNA glycosylase AlkD
VDVTTPNIVGEYLRGKKHDLLYTLVKSTNLWKRRVSVLATFAFIREKDFTDALRVAEILLTDKHDLIHKAVGWMLREVGKRDKQTLINFLDEHATKMPRTALRYAIEKFSAEERQNYLLRK